MSNHTLLNSHAMTTKTSTRTATPYLLSAICASVMVAGCANMDETQQDTAKGAGIGAVAGAVIGQIAGRNAAAGAAIGGVAGAVAGNVWSKRMQAQREAMERATRGTDVEVSRTSDNQLRVNIPNDISFASNSAAIKPELRSVLSTFAEGLGRDNAGMVVRIIGHTDSSGSDAINDPLSKERAESVKDFLVDRGVPARHIETIGRGDREPVASNATPEGRAKNRRVEIFLRDPEQKS